MGTNEWYGSAVYPASEGLSAFGGRLNLWRDGRQGIKFEGSQI